MKFKYLWRQGKLPNKKSDYFKFEFEEQGREWEHMNTITQKREF